MSHMVDLAAQTNLTLPWIPAHFGIKGNEQADRLAREGGQLNQEDRYTSSADEKTIIKTLTMKIWNQQLPNYNQSDSFHRLNRPEQVILFRMRTGHNRLNATCTASSRLPSLRCARATLTSWLQNIYYSTANYMISEVGHVAWTKTTEGQALWQPGGAEEDSHFREGNRHLHLAYETEVEKTKEEPLGHWRKYNYVLALPTLTARRTREHLTENIWSHTPSRWHWFFPVLLQFTGGQTNMKHVQSV